MCLGQTTTQWKDSQMCGGLCGFSSSRMVALTLSTDRRGSSINFPFRPPFSVKLHPRIGSESPWLRVISRAFKPQAPGPAKRFLIMRCVPLEVPKTWKASRSSVDVVSVVSVYVRKWVAVDPSVPSIPHRPIPVPVRSRPSYQHDGVRAGVCSDRRSQPRFPKE